MPRIAILVHAGQDFEHAGYYLQNIASVWQEEGHEVVVVHGTTRRVPADLAFLHVDLTVVPEPYLVYLRDYPVAVNAAVRDISKRVVSRQLVRRGDGYAGPVVVKSNRNCGGGPEWRLARRASRWRRRAQNLRARLPWSVRDTIATRDYRIYASVREVPRAVWFNRYLVVERFLPERDGEFYCLRTWTFLGDAYTHSRSWSHEPIIKVRNVIRREVLGEVPAALWQARRALGFGYGKFDYVVHQGQVVLLDANRTPAVRQLSDAVLAPNARILAAGIRSFIPGEAP